MTRGNGKEKLAKIRVLPKTDAPNDYGYGLRVWLDDVPIDFVHEVTIKMGMSMFPVVTMTLSADVDAETLAIVQRGIEE